MHGSRALVLGALLLCTFACTLSSALLFGDPHRHGAGFAVDVASSDDDALCPQHIGPPCPYYFNNTMPDYTPGSPVVIPPLMAAEMEARISEYARMIWLNAPPGYNDTTGNEYMVYVRPSSLQRIGGQLN